MFAFCYFSAINLNIFVILFGGQWFKKNCANVTPLSEAGVYKDVPNISFLCTGKAYAFLRDVLATFFERNEASAFGHA